MQEIVGYIGFVLIGVLLGLVGGGGSILALPVLVFLFHILPADATAYSLFVVGITSLAGSFTCIRRGDFNAEAIFLFGIPSLLSIYFTREFIIPNIPEVLSVTPKFSIQKEILILVSFSFVMIFSAFSMIRKSSQEKRNDLLIGELFNTPLKVPIVVFLGLTVGFVSGFVGAGGGFMIIPVLVVLLRIPMKKSIGTSLIIISVNSLVGFFGGAGHLKTDWNFLLEVSALAITGILAGRYISNYISGKKLKPFFGWLALFVGITILIEEILTIKN